ncbi:MAG TPA: winged helix-turn-helix transcriptional regulator [Pseudonocardia sp.]|uniref:winged helix-turn-helix transcriptional regulator n=1 Tax=Pseudonocardia sp. TaxID=60912 RepID=UPI002F41A6CF
MVGKRSYQDPCGVARALDAVGERWALLVVRELLLGPKRFADLARALTGMSQNVLTQRLRELEEAGVLTRRFLGPPTSSRVYELSPWGVELEPVLLALGRWGSRAELDADRQLSTDALVLALRTTFDPARSGGLTALIQLRLGNDSFVTEVGPGGLRISRGSAEEPVATVAADSATLRAVMFAGRPLIDAESAGELSLRGDRSVAVRFLAGFARPTGIEAPARERSAGGG